MKKINVIRKPNKTIVIYHNGRKYAKVDINPKMVKPSVKVPFKDVAFASCISLMLLFLVGVITYGVITGKGNQVKVAEAKEIKQSVVVIEKEKPETIPPILRKIAECESGNQHFDKNGKVIRGKVDKNDVGKYQISLTYHKAQAKKMGIDLMTEKGNEDYAKYLLNNYGTPAWRASSSCWLKK